jgi:hypothetical protein
MKMLSFLVVFVSLLGAWPAWAQTPDCQSLWMRRNAIFKESGLCFKTPRAISAFDNAGCRFDRADDVPLSNNDRNAIEEISRMEAVKGCDVADSRPAPTRTNSRCRVMDPTSTPLNVRTGPSGNIIAKLQNGTLVSVVESATDRNGRLWADVVAYPTGEPIGWVYREFISCF